MQDVIFYVFTKVHDITYRQYMMEYIHTKVYIQMIFKFTTKLTDHLHNYIFHRKICYQQTNVCRKFDYVRG